MFGKKLHPNGVQIVFSSHHCSSHPVVGAGGKSEPAFWRTSYGKVAVIKEIKKKIKRGGKRIKSWVRERKQKKFRN